MGPETNSTLLHKAAAAVVAAVVVVVEAPWLRSLLYIAQFKCSCISVTSFITVLFEYICRPS